ncbi:alpha/beta fold hydrolase [Portibacter lacus]|uniref:Alpha/beta hydrolase n=1 Tax=Portibacter lacus TaxID=1099794 RepID=A0AA37SQA6_9BACT|nr:alpha/beta hydrolase [Portibacter lacus]GLR19051.1 alpha/beta hydrolase [Portibacter lacus]
MEKVINSDINFIEIRGIQVAYRIIGEGVPLILFNRFRGTINDWDPAFISSLAKRNKVVAFDNFGVGATNGKSEDSVEGMAAIAYEFITQLGFEKVNILGWSMGGLIAQVFLLNYPNIVHKAILVGTGPGGSEQTEYPTERFLAVATKVYDMQPEHHQTVFFTDDQKGMENTIASLSRIEKYKNKIQPTQPITWAAQGMATKNFFASDKDYFTRIKEIHHDVLVAGSKEDIAFSDKNSFLLFKQIPNSHLLLYSNAAHAFHHQLPNKFGQAVEDFLTLK